MFFVFSISFSESLWNDNAGDIYTKKVYYRAGDSIKIILNESSVLEYRSNSKANKSYKAEISGGKITGIIDFLPQGSIEENKNSQDNDRLKLNAVIQARVTAIGNNYVTIRGIKDLTVNNKLSRIEIAGDAYLSDIKGNSIESNKLIDSKLRVTTLIDNNINVILDRDLSSDAFQNIAITNEKKKELLLQIINKILNVIFR